MSHQNKPPTGSPLHTATNQPSAFRHIHSPPPITLPQPASHTAQPSPDSAGATAAAMQARAAQMPAAAVASGQTATPASPAAAAAAAAPSSARVPPSTPSASRSPAAQPAHVLPLQLQTKVLRQTPTRSSPVTAAAPYPLPTYSPATGHSRMLSASSANAMLQQQQLQQQQSQTGTVPSARKTSTATGPPTPSPPQSERNSPATVMGAREQQTPQQQQQQAQASQQPSASLPAYPLSHSFPVLLPPPQFGSVAPFLFRCGRFYPDTHGSFLRDLHLRSICYLSHPLEHPLSGSIKNWAAEQGVDIVNIGAAVFGSAPVAALDSSGCAGSLPDWHHSVPGSSSASFLSLYSELVRLTLEHVLLASNSPVLLMCHNGIELCSLVVGCLRRLQRWTYTSVLDEFTRHTSQMQLRDPRSSAPGGGGPGSNRGAHHHHKSDLSGPSGSATASGIGGGASSESAWLAGTSCLRYAAAACNSTDLHRHYRLEELMELFDLGSVRIPELGPQPRKRGDSNAAPTPAAAAGTSAAPAVSLCVEWYRKQCAMERREHRAQKQARQMRVMQQLQDALAAQSDAATATEKSLASQEEKSACAPAVAAAPPLYSWSSDLYATYHSNRLLSAGLRFDKKATLVDEDED